MNKVIVINYKIIRECRINLYPMPVRDSILDMDLYSSIEMCMENGIPFTESYNRLGLFKYGYTNGLKIYTTETYEDVMKHYQKITNKKQKGSMKQKLLK